MFSLCPPFRGGGGGTPSQVCEWGGYPIPGVGGGTLSQVWVEGVPRPRSGGVPQPGTVLSTSCSSLSQRVQHRGLLRPEWDYFQVQVWMVGGGTPIPCQGVHWPGLDGGGYPIPGLRGYPYPPIRQSNIASTCYAAGGMPLAFTQENFLVWKEFSEFVQLCSELKLLWGILWHTSLLLKQILTNFTLILLCVCTDKKEVRMT